MKHITYVIPSLSVGGAEWQLLYLLRGLVKDHDVTVICTHHDGALSGDARRLGAFVRVIPTRMGGWDLTMKSKIGCVLRGHPPDILHSIMFGFDLFPCQAAREAGVPVVVSSRRQLATWKRWRHVWVQRKANKLVDRIVANSRAVADFAIRQEGADPALFHVIPNGINADDFVSSTDQDHVRRRHRIPNDRMVVGIVANFSPVKDYPLFVAIAEALLKKRRDLHFLVVGTGPLRDVVERRVQRRGLDDFFTRVSTVAERADLYTMMDVCVLCSKTEGFPNAVIEAMAAGTPVVAANVGGVPEAVIDEVTGRLVDSRDPEDFANAVAWTLDNPASGKAMAERAAQYVREQFPMQKMIDAYRALYAELLAKAPRKGP